MFGEGFASPANDVVDALAFIFFWRLIGWRFADHTRHRSGANLDHRGVDRHPHAPGTACCEGFAAVLVLIHYLLASIG